MTQAITPSSTRTNFDLADPFRWLWLAEAVEEHYGGYSSLRRYITEGRLATAEKVGKRWRVRKYDLDGLIVKRAVDPSPEDVEAAVARIVASAPPLSDSQIRKLGREFVSQLQRRQAA
ncbi:DNA-binding protein [Gordonia sp. HY285]|uniref:DNA-binding protein n=1 Tax=Gordonia liuliyuniae TaxID=2911517 RepID=UPI001F229B0C|nr:DNA-binding protein [Gordonia liuliyuniae]MCF8610207.1 DNA-binding protein [Gordonia liuliyuniae]